MKKHLLTTALSVLSCAAMVAPAMSARDIALPKQRDVYVYDRHTFPKVISPYSSTVYVGTSEGVRTLRGDELHNSHDSIVSLSVSPIGLSYILVEKGKKKSRASLYSVETSENRLASFDTKKFGRPTAAVFTPDARSVVIATDSAIYVADPKKINPIVRFNENPVVARRLAVSPNRFYLAAAAGDTVVVYNFETRKTRAILTAGEKVTDILFSPDNTDLAVLTSDGTLSLYTTRDFTLRKIVDDLGSARAAAYNLDGKYMGIVTGDDELLVVNLLQDSDREPYTFDAGGVSDVIFMPDAYNNTMMASTRNGAVELRRMPHLKPYFTRLIDDETNARMDEWLKMRPGESMEEYTARVNDENRVRQRSMFEYEISTRMAGNPLGDAVMSIGAYDRANGVLALNFDKMPTIYIPVSRDEVTDFVDVRDLSLNDVLYGVLPDDSFEIVYANVANARNGKTYVFDNTARRALNYMKADDVISIEVLAKQQMEEKRLNELRERVVSEARDKNVISDHTNISVASRLMPDYDADGKRVLNYIVSVTYTVDPDYSAAEDFGPGKYHIEESGAASSMMKIVGEALEGDFRKYLDTCKKLNVKLSGAADSTPIVSRIIYDGCYGDYTDEPVSLDGRLAPLTVGKGSQVVENTQLAFLRALGVKDYLEKNISGYGDISKAYDYSVSVAEGKGSEYRRITAEFTFMDVF